MYDTMILLAIKNLLFIDNLQKLCIYKLWSKIYNITL